MKLNFNCSHCLSDNETVNNSLIEIRDDNFYQITCDKGHVSHFYIQNLKFELLFDAGSMALIDGYPNAAVAYISSSLERLHEFCIHVYSKVNDIDDDIFKKNWKYFNNSSERQLGAFLNSFMLFEQSTLKFDLQKYSAFRNKVIHKGYLPSYQEVVDFGDLVLEHIRFLLELFRNKYGDSISKVVFDHINASSLHSDSNVQYSALLIPTKLSIGHPLDSMPKKFIDVIESLKQFSFYRLL
ncbi:MAG: hypothetical protein V7733_09970 [Paraglaciecola polaris]|uniref:hypothetical protein n=2 Tax=Paraglaciecola polaris TaxID=222814 RepID=UPI0030021D0F